MNCRTDIIIFWSCASKLEIFHRDIYITLKEPHKAKYDKTYIYLDQSKKNLVEIEKKENRGVVMGESIEKEEATPITV